MITLFLVPSFYAFISLLIAYIFTLVTVDGVCLSVTHTVMITAIMLNFLATILFKREYSNLAKASVYCKDRSSRWATFFFILGAIGVFQYLASLKGFFGSYTDFFSVLLSSAHEIRWANAELSNAPFLIYFGWVGLFVYFANPGTSKKAKKFKILILLLIAINFSGNLLFLDRTRPFWLVFFCLMAYVYRNKASTGRILMGVALVVPLLVAFFWGIGSFIGKISGENFIQNIKIYLTSGVLYLNFIIENDLIDPNGFRLIYPIGKVLQQLGVDVFVPSQILPFYNVPFLTNVGTYMEPAYTDAGPIGLVFFLIFHSFVLNYVCLWCLKSKNLIPSVFWVSICFCGLLAFFTPKFNTTFVYFVLMLMVVEFIFNVAKSALHKTSPKSVV